MRCNYLKESSDCSFHYNGECLREHSYECPALTKHQKAYAKKYYEKHREEHNAYMREYRRTHREKLREYQRQYYKEHSEKICYQQKLYRFRKADKEKTDDNTQN